MTAWNKPDSLGARGPGRSSATQWHDPWTQIEAEGEQRPQLRLLVSGWAARARTLSDGRRQIIRILIPGDLCGVALVRGTPSRAATVALTRARTIVQTELSEALQSNDRRDPRALAVLAEAEAQEHVGLVDHIVRLGRMSAYERTAHLLLELFERQRRAGLTQGTSMPLPISQEMLADALGLSIVHTNRVLQQLRRDGFIVSRAGRVVFNDIESLRQACGYVPPDASARAEAESFDAGRLAG